MTGYTFLGRKAENKLYAELTARRLLTASIIGVSLGFGVETFQLTLDILQHGTFMFLANDATATFSTDTVLAVKLEHLSIL